MVSRALALLLLLAAAPLSGCDDRSARCRSLSFPAPPSDAGDPVFVAGSCPEDSGDGTREHPFASLVDGVEKAPSGATILVAEYSSFDEQLVIEKPLRILGSAPESQALDATVTLRPTTGPGIFVTSGAKDVVLRGLVIERGKGAGVWVSKGASATLDGFMVHDAETDGDGHYGYGILADDGASVALTRVTVDGATEVGVYVQGAAASFDDVSVTNVVGRGAIRLEDATDTVSMSKVIIQSSTEVGILVASSKAKIADTLVLGMLPGDSGIADGIVVTRRKGPDGAYLGEARADVEATVVRQAARVGVLFSDGATGSLTGCTISDCAANVSEGGGVWLQLGAGSGDDGVLITNSQIRTNYFLNVVLKSGAKGRLINNLDISYASDALLFSGNQYLDIGDGIGVFEGAFADIESSFVTQNSRFGILLDHPDPATIVKSNFIRNNTLAGLVIQHAGDGIPAFADNSFENNGTGDALVLGPNEPSFGVPSADLSTP